jgi:hypothetical protein
MTEIQMAETTPAARFGFRDGERIQSWDRLAVAFRKTPFVQRTWQKNVLFWSLMFESFEFVSDFGFRTSDFCCWKLTYIVWPNHVRFFTGAGPEGIRLCCFHAA